MPDLLIPLREKLLDIISGSHRARILNPAILPDTNRVSTPDLISKANDPAAELYELLHEVLSSGLANHGGCVDYVALRVNPLYEDFRRCTAKLRTFNPLALPDRDAQVAFWINLYNTLVLDAVIAMGVQRSVTERRAGIHFFRQAAYEVGGQRMSCDDIEHGILRSNRGHPLFPGKQFGKTDPRMRWVIEPFDVRIHFALNCASRSCPPIRGYSPEKLDAQLDLATRGYLATDVQIVPNEKALYLSSIFKWFEKDFGGRDGVIEFVLSHLSDAMERTWLMGQREKVSLRHNPYDWSLNRKNQTESI